MHPDIILDELVEYLEACDRSLVITRDMATILSNYIWAAWYEGYNNAHEHYGEMK